MFWYLITILFFIGSIFSWTTGLNSSISITLTIISGFFFLVSFFVSIVGIIAQNENLIDLKKIRITIDTLLDKYKLLHKEKNLLVNIIMDHDLDYINSLCIEIEEGSNSFNNIQIPPGQAIDKIKQLAQEIENALSEVISVTESYNRIIRNLKETQANRIFCSPFIKRNKVLFIKVNNIEEYSLTSVEEIEENL